MRKGWRLSACWCLGWRSSIGAATHVECHHTQHLLGLESGQDDGTSGDNGEENNEEVCKVNLVDPAPGHESVVSGTSSGEDGYSVAKRG